MARRGRPPVAPGQRSIACSLSLEASLYHQIEALATDRRVTVPDAMRALLRDYFTKKLPNEAESFTLVL